MRRLPAKVYLPELLADQPAWFDEWRDTVVAAVKKLVYMYMRSTKYDWLLSLLFPEMAEGLAKSFGKRPVVPDLRWDEGKKRFLRSHTEQQSRPAGFLSREQAARDPLRRAAGGDIQDWFLKGVELEAWKRVNPRAAQDWEATLKRYGVE